MEQAWQEDAALILKAIFKLGGYRQSKATSLRYYNCLTWINNNQCKRLSKNLEAFNLYDPYWLINYSAAAIIYADGDEEVNTEEERLSFLFIREAL